nr:unnamed protein product [Spirometra erinaceieuropaei]
MLPPMQTNMSTDDTTIFAAGKDIKQDQLVVLLFLHRESNVWKESVESFFKFRHLHPFADNEADYPVFRGH